MATPVTDLFDRLRHEGMPEGQARIIAGAFEQLDRRLRRIEIIAAVNTALLIGTLTTVIVQG
jgi:hypothetical protein